MSNTWKVYLLALTSFLVGTSQYVISGILDKISDSLGISLGAAGQLITVFSLVYGICTPILMALTSRMARRTLMMHSLGLFVIGNFLAFLMPGYSWFLVARLIMALGAGMIIVNALTIAVKIADKGRQGSAIATVVMGFTASLIIGVPFGRVAAEAFDWKYIFAVIAIGGLIAMMVLFYVIPQDTKGDQPLPLLQQFSLLKKPKVALGLSITFFTLAGYSVVYTYLSPYLTQVSGMKESMLSGIFVIFGVASLIGSKFGGYSTDRWGVKTTLMGGMSLHIIMLILLSFVTGSFSGVLTVLILWSFAAWTSGPTQQYHLATIDPKSSGVLLGFNQSIMQLGLAAGAGSGGIIVEKMSLASVTWIGALVVLLGIVATFVVFRLANQERSKNNTMSGESI